MTAPHSTVADINSDLALVHAALRGELGAMTSPGNPMAEALGTRIVAAEADRIVLEFERPSSFLQGAGVLQGGTVTAMLDFAMAFATLTGVAAGGSCTTVTMNVSFLRPALPGRYQAEGSIERRGRTMAFARARVINADTGAAVATATSALALAGSIIRPPNDVVGS